MHSSRGPARSETLGFLRAPVAWDVQGWFCYDAGGDGETDGPALRQVDAQVDAQVAKFEDTSFEKVAC